MASIRARTNKDGSISYRAEIRIKRAGKIVWRESGTYPRKKLSETWAAKRELQLAEPGALDRAIAGLETNALTVSELIDILYTRFDYSSLFDSGYRTAVSNL
jgi:hypothetical protein